MTSPVLEYRTPGRREQLPPISVLEKVVYIILGVLLPLLCFVLSAHRYPAEPEWQSGGWDRYLLFVPSGRVGYPFFPLLACSMLCLIGLVIRFELSRYFLLRLGLYTGILLSLQYSLIQASALSAAHDPFDPEFLVSLGVGLASNVVLFGGIKLLQLVWRRSPKAAIGSIAAVLALVLIIGTTRSRLLPRINLSETGMLVVIGAPAWCAGTYAMAAWTAWRHHRREARTRSPWLPRLLAPLIWIAAYWLAWKWTMANAVKAYAALPPSSPGCYIATAAATGHRRWVGSTRAMARDGSTYWANAQLRRLKCLEVAVATLCPAAHRVARRAYDVAGPPLARLITPHPLLADAAYLALKPVELIGFGLLASAVPEVRRAAKGLYPSWSA
jgi:hypothetical protein